ncbi:MAG: hypothetical protein U9Q81_14195 [Pseudomonadota bacterium]|nr:hypothetical protein [Pseudomonadota bacterium]
MRVGQSRIVTVTGGFASRRRISNVTDVPAAAASNRNQYGDFVARMGFFPIRPLQGFDAPVQAFKALAHRRIDKL